MVKGSACHAGGGLAYSDDLIWGRRGHARQGGLDGGLAFDSRHTRAPNRFKLAPDLRHPTGPQASGLKPLLHDDI
jgi:hypothetical protein